MMINVPQYIDVEDKLVGPLTAKQLGWVALLFIIMLFVYKMLPLTVTIIIGIPLAILILGLAFFRPYGHPLGSFILFGIRYFFRPKIYFWKRSDQGIPKIAPKKYDANAVNELQIQKKRLTAESLKELSQLLDSEGTQYNKDIEDILKKDSIKR